MEIETLAASLGIALQPGWHETVHANLQISQRLANQVAEFPLDDEADLAPIFTP